MFDDEDPEQEQRERERVRKLLGDPKTITPEVVAWVNARARVLREAPDFEGMTESVSEGRQLFPDCGWIFFLLYRAVAMRKEISVSHPLFSAETEP